MIPFKPFPKMGRLFRECIITEKIDGTNASIYITQLAAGETVSLDAPFTTCFGDMVIYTGSRTQWITPEKDNFGFASWVRDNAHELVKLGVGHHFGEWWGQGIQRKYGLDHKRFSLFNAMRWCEHDKELGVASESWDDKQKCFVTKMQERAPSCCHVVPVLYRGMFSTLTVAECIRSLEENGSAAAQGFRNPEGIVTFHLAGQVGFKTTIEDDHQPKGKQ